MTIVIPINFPLPAGLLTAAMSCAIVTFSGLILAIFLLKNRIKSCYCCEISAEYWEIRWAYQIVG